MKTITRYRLKKELPRYDVGTEIVRLRSFAPSQYNSGNYQTSDEFYQADRFPEMKCVVIDYVGSVIKRAIDDYNIVAEDWVEVLEEEREYSDV